MKKHSAFAIFICATLLAIIPNLASANAISTQQARTEHMRACLSNGGKKDVCTCSFERASQVISPEDIMNLNRSLTNKIPGKEEHLELLQKVTRKCAKDIEDGLYTPSNPSINPSTPPALPSPNLPTLPKPSADIPAPPSLPKPPSFSDLDNLTIPEPPALKKAAPSFDDDKNSEGYFSDTSIDINEDPKKVAAKSKPSFPPDSPPDVVIEDPKESYQGEYDKYFFEAATRGDLNGLSAISQYLKTLDIVDRAGNTPLMVAVNNGHFAAAKFMVAHGASAKFQNRTGQTPLHLAVFKRRPDIAQLLLDNKADINASYSGGFTPLMLAIMNNDELMLQKLLISGANPRTVMRDGNAALHIAATSDNPRIVEILKNYGADLNAENGLGYTPLMVAASQNKINAANALLSLGADFNRTDIYGRTAAQIAYSLGYTQIVNLLLTMQEKQRSGY